MNFEETSKILTIFSERAGKIKAIARGVRKIKSKMAGSLEPYILVDLQLHLGKTFYIVTGASIVEEYKNIHSDIKKTAQAYLAGELIDKFLAEGEKSAVAFQTFLDILRAIDVGERDFIVSAFQLKIVEASGFKPELNFCIHCKEKLTAGKNFWDHIEGGVICVSCQQEFHHGTLISDGAIKALRFIEHNDFSTIAKIRLDQKIEDEVEKILSEYIKNILERDLKSRKFLHLINKKATRSW